jgi:hypothetical protein
VSSGKAVVAEVVVVAEAAVVDVAGGCGSESGGDVGTKTTSRCGAPSPGGVHPVDGVPVPPVALQESPFLRKNNRLPVQC